jgi:hypothetical protein
MASPRKKRRKDTGEKKVSKEKKTESKTELQTDNGTEADYNIKEVYDIVSQATMERSDTDVLYHILFVNDDLSVNACDKIRKHLENKYPSMSARLRAMINFACTSEHRVAHHALILFALSSEEGAADVLSSLGTLPTKKFVHFREHALATETLNLLQGKTTSMRAYVEDVRSAYFTE